MKRIRFYFAMIAAKTVMFLLKALGRNATHFPGQVAVMLCGDFLEQITPPKTVVAVTGTNGKTTVSNLVTSVLRECGYSVTNNSAGSNIQAGVATALLADSTIGGKPTKDIAVLEVDERSSLRIYPYLKPDWLICNNIMQDSVKRNAHTEFISYFITSAIPVSTKLVLNADDLICADLAPLNKNRTYFGLDADLPQTDGADASAKSLVYCPDCGGPLKAEKLRYNHIGRMYCPSCGKCSPQPDFRVTAVDRERGTFTVSDAQGAQTYRLLNDNIVNIYNACGAIALLRCLGVSSDGIRAAFEKAHIVETRHRSMEVCGQRITMLMAKGSNPIACTRCFSYVAKQPGNGKRVVLMFDDKYDNVGHSENVCWFYDCDYSYLADPSISQVIFAGPRRLDHRLCALLAGVPEERLSITDDYAAAPSLLRMDGGRDIYLLYDFPLDREVNGVADGIAQRLKEEAAK